MITKSNVRHNIFVMVASLGLVLLAGCKSKPNASQPLAIYCAAGLREPMAELTGQFDASHGGGPTRADYGGSGELLGRMKTASPENRPDVFVAAEESYAQQAAEAGLIDSQQVLAYFVPVIVVQKGNPKNIRALADLARPDLRVALGEPRGPAIGLVSDQILKHANLEAVRKNAAGSFTTVQAVAAQVALRNADAAIIWDATARQGDFADKLDAIAIPGAPVVRIIICRVKNAPHSQLADEFIKLATSEHAKATFRKHGFTSDLPADAASQAASGAAP